MKRDEEMQNNDFEEEYFWVDLGANLKLVVMNVKVDYQFYYLELG